MGTDIREEGICISVPIEMVNALVESTLATLRDWHEDNDMEADLGMCSAAIMVMAKMITSQFTGYPLDSGTLQ